MKKHIQKIKISLAILGVALFVFSQTRLENRWDQNSSLKKRNPASIKFFEGKDPNLYGDYFSKNHKMDIKFWTDKDGESIKKRARLALHMAISETLLKKRGEELPKDLFKENLIEAFSKKFLKSLYILKIINGTFQVDLHFEPHQIKNFESLMSTNQFIDSNQTGTLLKNLNSKEKDFEDKLLSRTSSPSKNYQNLGGVITLWFKVADLNWDPLNPIPNPPKNAVKGFVKYRRYFKMNPNWTPSIPLSGLNTKLNGKWLKNDKPRIITVDLTKPFNLKNLKPISEKIEVHFGKIKYPKHFREGPIANLDFFSKDSRPNKLLFTGHDQTKNFEFELKKLVFDFEQKRFSQSSQVKSHGDWSGFSLGQKRKFKSQVRHSLLGDDSLQMIKALKLYRFHSMFKEVGSL